MTFPRVPRQVHRPLAGGTHGVSHVLTAGLLGAWNMLWVLWIYKKEMSNMEGGAYQTYLTTENVFIFLAEGLEIHALNGLKL
jgi:hypothetical protein